MVQETGVQSQIKSYLKHTHTKKVLDASLLNTKHYHVWIKDKWSNPGKEVVPSLTPVVAIVKRGSLGITLQYAQPIYK